MRSARPRRFYVIPSIVDERMRQHEERKNEEREKETRVCTRGKRERETVRAKGRERKKEYVNDFTNERPWDRRKCAGAPSSGWADRMNVNAS